MSRISRLNPPLKTEHSPVSIPREVPQFFRQRIDLGVPVPPTEPEMQNTLIKHPEIKMSRKIGTQKRGLAVFYDGQTSLVALIGNSWTIAKSPKWHSDLGT